MWVWKELVYLPDLEFGAYWFKFSHPHHYLLISSFSWTMLRKYLAHHILWSVVSIRDAEKGLLLLSGEITSILHPRDVWYGSVGNCQYFVGFGGEILRILSIESISTHFTPFSVVLRTLLPPVQKLGVFIIIRGTYF